MKLNELLVDWLMFDGDRTGDVIDMSTRGLDARRKTGRNIVFKVVDVTHMSTDRHQINTLIR